MGTTADKLNKLLQTKQEIKQAIIDKGVEVTDEDTFASYPEKISSIQGGDGVNWLYIISDGGTRGQNLFYKCGNTTELDLSNFDTANITDMSYMFYDCSNLTSLDLSNFDTSNVTDMNNMFNRCHRITSLDVSNFDTSKVTNMSNMFSYIGYMSSTATSLDLSNFDTSNVTDMNSMFNYCSNLTSLDLSNFDTSKVTNMGSMFYNCLNLTSLDLSNFDVSKVTNIGYMFYRCSNLTSLDLSNFDISKVTNMSNMISNCTKLVDFYPPQNINADMSTSNSTALSHDSLLRILNNLMTTTTTKTLTLGATNLAKLTDEEKAIATDKGWTLT